GPHERGDGGGSTLVDVGLPAVEGYRADLEEHPDRDHADPHEQERLGLTTLEDVRATGGHGLTNRAEVHRARVAVDHSDPEQEEPRGKGAEQEVLHRGLLREQASATGDPA